MWGAHFQTAKLRQNQLNLDSNQLGAYLEYRYLTTFTLFYTTPSDLCERADSVCSPVIAGRQHENASYLVVRRLFDVRFCLTKCRRHDFEALPVSIRARPLIGLLVVKSEMVLSLLSTNSQESLLGLCKYVN
jgi:hypothetical protein